MNRAYSAAFLFALLSIPAFPQKNDFPLTVHITAVTAEQGQHGVVGHGSTDSNGNYSSTVSGGGTYTWKLYTARIEGDQKTYGLSTPRMHYKGGKGLAVATMGWSIIATARPNHWLHIGEYNGRWNQDGTLEIQFIDEKGKLTHQVFAVESEEATPTTSSSIAEQAPHSDVEAGVVQVREAAPGNGTCSITSSPDGAEVELDGNFVGNTPSALAVAEGEHTLEIKKAGFKVWQRKLKVTSGSSVHINAELDKL